MNWSVCRDFSVTPISLISLKYQSDPDFVRLERFGGGMDGSTGVAVGAKIEWLGMAPRRAGRQRLKSILLVSRKTLPSRSLVVPKPVVL